ncbi:MAG: flagellar hook capping protein [Lawsonibacter sp.]|nr:flagellar hook capping protein [Lawsonibacter sp.]
MDSYSYDTAYRYGNYNKANDFDPTINRWEEAEKAEKENKDKGTLTFTDMLTLMVTQFQNQTPDNQADSSDMMNQLVQMSVMQAMNDMTSQMKELALANVMSYAASLVGQTVTVGVWNDETEELEELVGVVKGTGTYNGQQVIYLDNGEGYFLSDIMAVGTLPPKKEEETPGEGEGEGEGSGEGEDNKTETENEVG